MAEKNHNDEIKTNDLPQDFTESSGTGVTELPGYNIGGHSIREDGREYTETSPDADAVGDDAVGGSTANPDQNVTEELETAAGLEMDDSEFLHTNDILEERDGDRWELDPKSSEDYQTRRE
jgi:hypothetical protein